MIEGMNVTCLIFGAVFLIAGFVFFIGRGHTMLKAWQNMPEEEKAEILIKPLCRNVGLVVMLCGVIFLISGLWEPFKNNGFALCMAAWMVICVVDIIHIEKSGRYRVDGKQSYLRKTEVKDRNTCRRR